jgi:hypothetical protein
VWNFHSASKYFFCGKSNTSFVENRCFPSTLVNKKEKVIFCTNRPYSELVSDIIMARDNNNSHTDDYNASLRSNGGQNQADNENNDHPSHSGNWEN